MTLPNFDEEIFDELLFDTGAEENVRDIGDLPFDIGRPIFLPRNLNRDFFGR